MYKRQNLPVELAVGVMIIAAVPGGATSNFFTSLAKGDVALSISLTAITSLICIISIPFIANGTIDITWFYVPLVILVITGTSNAVNLTDGLDGLATGLVAIATLVFGAIAYASGRMDYSDYLNIIYLPGAGELSIFSGAMTGACLGFMV